MADELVVAGCSATAFRCHCQGGHGPDEPHACDCGGSWRGEGDTFEVVSFPHDPVTEALGLPPEVGALLAGGVRRGGIRWPILAEETSDG